MIREVKLRSFRPNALPHKFEAGTPAVAEAIGFEAAVDYLAKLGMGKIALMNMPSLSTPWNVLRRFRA